MDWDESELKMARDSYLINCTANKGKGKVIRKDAI